MWVCSTCHLPIQSPRNGYLIADDDLRNWRTVHRLTCDPHVGPWYSLETFVGKEGARVFQSLRRAGAFSALSPQEIDTLQSMIVCDVARTKAPMAVPKHKPVRLPKQADGRLKLRFTILKRDGYRCQLCGRSAQDGITLEVDHKTPRAKGGRDDPTNLWTLCFDCNRGKSDSDL